MTILLPAALVIVGLMVWGLVTSRTRRGVDRRHFAAFVGFIAALVAVTGTTVELVLADLHPHSMSPAWQGFGFITAIIAIVAIAVTLFSGLLSRGTQRISLVSCGIVVALTYLFGLVSHFGD